MVSRAAEGGRAAIADAMAAAAGRESGALLRATDEDQVGELQPQGTHDSPQHRAGQETAGVPRIHRCARTGSLARTDPQRPLRCADGPIHAQVAVPPPRAQSPTGSAREVELLKGEPPGKAAVMR